MLEGRDVIGRARTGSGKTAAYGLPLLQRIQKSTGVVRSLILAPTRELALQITEALRDLARDLPVQVVTIYGGAPYGPQLRALNSGVPIVVGTPGRVLDHMKRGSLNLSHVELLVLDEADEMLRMGFIDAVEEVVASCPEERQVALLSATMPDDIRRVAAGHLRDPVELQLGDDRPRVDHVSQCWIRVAHRDKLEVLGRLLRVSPPGATLVFVRTRAGCAEVADALSQMGIGADALHGDMAQPARERVVARLRAGAIDVVCATDVAARGIDVEHIGRVVNLDMPDEAEVYVHRIGRTARAGREGEAVTLVTSRERQRLVRFSRQLGIRIEQRNVPTDADIARHGHRRLAAILGRVRGEGDLAPAEEWMSQLVEEGWTVGEIAAAAVQQLATMSDIDLRPAPPEPVRVERVPPPRDVSGAHIPVFLPIGDRHGVRPGDIVGALANEVGIPTEHIGRIAIEHRKSFVGLPQSVAEHLVNFGELEIRGHQIKPALAAVEGGDRPPKRARKVPRQAPTNTYRKKY